MPDWQVLARVSLPWRHKSGIRHHSFCDWKSRNIKKWLCASILYFSLTACHSSTIKFRVSRRKIASGARRWRKAPVPWHCLWKNSASMTTLLPPRRRACLGLCCKVSLSPSPEKVSRRVPSWLQRSRCRRHFPLVHVPGSRVAAEGRR